MGCHKTNRFSVGVFTYHTHFISSWIYPPVRPGRNGEPWGPGPGGAWLQDALPIRVPQLLARAHAFLLEEGPRREAYVWVPAGLPRGLLHLHRTPVSAWREPIEPHTEPKTEGQEPQHRTICTNRPQRNACERIWAYETHVGGTWDSSAETKWDRNPSSLPCH